MHTEKYMYYEEFNFHEETHLCAKTQVKKQNTVRTLRVPLLSLLRTTPLTKGNN